MEILIISFLICILLFIGFYKRKSVFEEYEINLSNIDKNKTLNWYKHEIKEQIDSLLYEEYEKDGDIIRYKAPMLYIVNEEFIEVEYNPYFIRIKSSRMIRKIMENLLEIELVILNNNI